MNAAAALFRRLPAVAVALYGVSMLAFAALIVTSIGDVVGQRAALASARDLLGQLEARTPAQAQANALAGGPAPEGAPMLGGETITVAGAALLQRVADAIARNGGTVQSSQVDLRGPLAKDDFVTLVISCEMPQPSLQKLLYDLEAGMPFLFVDQLVAQAPQGADANSGRMRILLAVSGRWQGRK